MVPQLSLLMLPRLNLLLEFVIIKVVFLRVVNIFIKVVPLLCVLDNQRQIWPVDLKFSTAVFKRILDPTDGILLSG